jgi:hypothetical protein
MMSLATRRAGPLRCSGCARSVLHEAATRIAHRQSAPVALIEDALRRSVGVMVAVQVGRQLLRTAEAGLPIAHWLEFAALAEAEPAGKRRRHLDATDGESAAMEAAADSAQPGGPPPPGATTGASPATAPPPTGTGSVPLPAQPQGTAPASSPTPAQQQPAAGPGPGASAGGSSSSQGGGSNKAPRRESEAAPRAASMSTD